LEGRIVIRVRYLLLALCIPVRTALGITPPELVEGVEKRIDSYRNLKFEYTAKTRVVPAPEQPDPRDDGVLRESKEVFMLLDSNRGDMSRMWTFWKQSLRQPDGRWVLNQFVAFDGAMTTEYNRSRSPDEDRSTGRITPFDTLRACVDNPFSEVLLGDINGARKCEDPEFKLSRSLDVKWELVGSGRFEQQETYILRANMFQGQVEWEAEVTGAPNYLLVRRTVRDLSKQSRPVQYLFEVASAGHFRTIAYASKGKLFREAIGHSRGIEYEFDVTSVDSLTDAVRADWQPRWPPGTAVSDHVKNETFQVARDKAEEERLKLAREVRAPVAVVGWSTWRIIFFVINVTVVAVLIAVFAWRWWKQRGTLKS
jgi:hypothetical protein